MAEQVVNPLDQFAHSSESLINVNFSLEILDWVMLIELQVYYIK